MENIQQITKVDQSRRKAIQYLGLCLLSVFVSYFFSKNFMTKDFLKAKAEFDSHSFDILHMDYIFFFLIGPFIFSGWITLSKILGLLRSNTQWFVSPVIWFFMMFFKLILAFMIGSFMFPILVIYHLIQLIFAPKLGFLNNLKSANIS